MLDPETTKVRKPPGPKKGAHEPPDTKKRAPKPVEETTRVHGPPPKPIAAAPKPAETKPIASPAAVAPTKKRMGSPRIGAALGRTGALFLIASNFAFLFAPIFYLVDLRAHVPSSDSWSVALLLLTDPARVFAFGDLTLLIGGALLAVAVMLLLRALPRTDRKPPRDAFLWGGATGVALVMWTIATVVAQSRARGGIDAVAATGGWSVAAIALLAASLAFAMFAVRVDSRSVPLRRKPSGLPPAHHGLAPLRWPLYAFINLAGTAFLASPQGGDEMLAFMGLLIMIVFLPLLGILTYRDVKKTFKDWPRVMRTWVLPAPAPAPGPSMTDATIVRPPHVGR